MSYYKKFKQLEYNKNIFRQHCFSFRLQCAALREQNGDCKKLLQIESMFLTLISRINKIDAFKRSLYDNYIRQFNKIVLHMEKLELDLAQLRGQDYVKSLKKTKILAFCNYVNLSIAEADSIPNYQMDQLVEQLLKLKKTCFVFMQWKVVGKNFTSKMLNGIKEERKQSQITLNIRCDRKMLNEPSQCKGSIKNDQFSHCSVFEILVSLNSCRPVCCI